MDKVGGTVLTVNGRRRTTQASPETPLLYVLRNDFGLKGTRFGCGDGECGACMVLIDKQPTSSCDLPVSAVGPRGITTIEGIGSEARPHPVQQAILDLQAAQCGFCLTGVIMTGVAIAEERSGATRAQIVAALDGVLCRCGAQDRMIRAIEQAAQSMPART